MSQPKHVLIAEDSKTQAIQLKFLLEKSGFEVTVGYNGKEAFDSIEQRQPDIIISDIVMPEMDGYQLCQAIRTNEKYNNLPIILLTSLSNAEDVIKALENGADYFVTKPYKDEFLLHRIDEALKTVEYHSNSGNGNGNGRSIFYAGKRFTIDSQPSQMLRLLISTYENAVQQKSELQEAHDDLQSAHRQLTKKNHQLEQLNEEKNRFLGMAAHDLRNPITMIHGFCSLLISEVMGPVTDGQKEMLEKASKNSMFMNKLLEELLDVTQIESGKLNLNLDQTDLNELIEENLSLNRMISEKKEIGIDFQSSFKPPKIFLDQSKIEQVLNNLITNAIKFSHQNTTINVQLEDKDGLAQISVQDQGQGIPADEVEKVFQPFEKTSVQSTAGEKSTGLGLAIVKKIIEGHKGKIWVESEYGTGATFIFQLPLNLQPEEA